MAQGPQRVILHQALDKPVVLFDGQCIFCQRQAANLAAIAGPDAFDLLDFHQPGVLERFEGLDHEACMRAMQLIDPAGNRFEAMEAAARALMRRPLIGWLAYLYYLPGVRSLSEWVYRRIAKRRYDLMGRRGECDGTTCHVPFE